MCRRLPGAVLLIGGAEDGETCAIAALARSRFATTVAIGRRVIRAFSPIGAPALPWGDRARFAEAMLRPDPETRDAAPRLAPPGFSDDALPGIGGDPALEGPAVPDGRGAGRRDPAGRTAGSLSSPSRPSAFFLLANDLHLH